MNNEFINSTPEKNSATGVNLEKNAAPVTDEVSSSANETAAELTQPEIPQSFEYQPPQVDIPEPPSFESESQMTDVKASDIPQQPVQPQPVVQQPYQQQPYQQAYQQPYQQQAPYQAQQMPYTQQYYQYTPVDQSVIYRDTADGFAIASLILSIVGIVSCCGLFVPSILAIIFACVSKAKNDGTRPTGMSTAGLVIGIVGLVLNLLFWGLMWMENSYMNVLYTNIIL